MSKIRIKAHRVKGHISNHHRVKGHIVKGYLRKK